MSKEKNTQSVIVAILVLVTAGTALVVIGWYISKTVARIIGWLSEIDGQVTIGALTASATVMASVFAVLVAQRSIKKREISEAHRAEKTELYSGFINKTVETLKQNKKMDGDLHLISDEDLINYFYDFHAKLVLWGSKGTIQKYHAFRRLSVVIETKNAPAKEVILLVDDIFKEMRKDLGGNTRFLRRGSLIRLFLNEEIPD